ncbi:quinone oxidoreductase family protein [Hydrogenophaga crocea]|uniref:Zinc-binding dehydrogenase n=1 Tax=Hydrogenophaga crocea TaxID=2716225 RepID=A0A6G8IC43_9BURK|nr:zinc-binding dehydrogenase [Hydrogenophaga crocea]QIM50747.1 zinc-binding dehydrogenase [Hydrogenophaga crocea]
MRAIAQFEFGSADVLRVCDMPMPTLRPHDVLVRVAATSVNPADLRARRPSSARSIAREFPLVLGYDFSGSIVELGSKVAGWQVGDEVIGCPSLMRQGANAEFIAVDHRVIARKPKALTHVEAASLPLVGLTAWGALVDRANLREDQTVLIHGGAGGVGHVAAQLVQLLNARPVVTCGSSQSLAFCRDRLGLNTCLDYRAEDYADRLLESTQGRGFDVALETVGGDNMNVTMSAMAPLSQVVCIVPSAIDGLRSGAFMKSITVHYNMMTAPLEYERQPEKLGENLATLAYLVEQGQLRPVVDRVWPVSEMAVAHKALEAGGVTGKLAIDVADGWLN